MNTPQPSQTPELGREYAITHDLDTEFNLAMHSGPRLRHPESPYCERLTEKGTPNGLNGVFQGEIIRVLRIQDRDVVATTVLDQRLVIIDKRIFEANTRCVQDVNSETDRNLD
ncbi:hypothetical protein KBD59_01885 [Candidatus Gracilibacteria bacterium]|nr:hypothetical protein [Candidatus Gracilibacteria bacterium]